MVIVIPLAATDRLLQTAKIHQLDLPIPLSSGCASYLSTAEMDTILAAIAPLSQNDQSAANLVSELQGYQAQLAPVVPCESE